MDRYGRARAVIDMGVAASENDAPEVSGDAPPHTAKKFSARSVGATTALGTGVALAGTAGAGAVVATGVLLGKAAIVNAVKSDVLAMLYYWTTGKILLDISIPTAGMAIGGVLGVGILALTVAFLACFFAPGKKRSGGASRFVARALPESSRNQLHNAFEARATPPPTNRSVSTDGTGAPLTTKEAAMLSESRQNSSMLDGTEQEEGNETD